MKIKKAFPILLAAWPYLPFLMASGADEAFYALFWGGYLFLTILLYLANILYACRYQGENADYRLAFCELLIKLAHIPFYLIAAFSSALLLIAMVVPAFILLSPIMIAVLMLIDLFLMVTTSIYGVNALIRACRKKTVSKKFMLVNLVLHFIFVLDVVSSIAVFTKLRKQKKLNSGAPM